MRYYRFTTLVVILFWAVPEILNAQTTGYKPVINTVMSQSISPDHQILSQLNARFIRNFLSQDTVSHSSIIHKDFLCIESSGELVGREQYLRNWATDFDNSGYASFSYDDEVIRIFGNVALIRSKTTYTKLVDGKEMQGHTIYTDTYVKENGKWLCVQVQITPVKNKSNTNQ